MSNTKLRVRVTNNLANVINKLENITKIGIIAIIFATSFSAFAYTTSTSGTTTTITIMYNNDHITSYCPSSSFPNLIINNPNNFIYDNILLHF